MNSSVQFTSIMLGKQFFINYLFHTIIPYFDVVVLPIILCSFFKLICFIAQNASYKLVFIN